MGRSSQSSEGPEVVCFVSVSIVKIAFHGLTEIQLDLPILRRRVFVRLHNIPTDDPHWPRISLLPQQPHDCPRLCLGFGMVLGHCLVL